MINVGVIGFGYWGPNLVRNFAETPGCQVVAVSDLSNKRFASLQARYPTIKTTVDYKEVINDPAIDAVVIATPISTHFPLALEALQAGKHVLVEKPLVTSSEDGWRLLEEAAKRNLTLMVDHTFVYSGPVQKINELTKSGELGDLYYYDSVRINLGLIQSDVDVIWDLAVHDLSIMDHVFKDKPCAISATGINHFDNTPATMAYLTLFFESSFIAHIHVNWLAPVKIRRTLIGGAKKMIVYDDLEPSEKIKIYDKGVTLNSTPESRHKALVAYRTGDMWSPQCNRKEALALLAEHFIECIDKSQTPITDGMTGLRIVRMLEAATASMNNRGAPISLDWNKNSQSFSNKKLVVGV